MRTHICSSTGSDSRCVCIGVIEELCASNVNAHLPIALASISRSRAAYFNNERRRQPLAGHSASGAVAAAAAVATLEPASQPEY